MTRLEVAPRCARSGRGLRWSRPIALGALLTIGALAIGACSANKNYEERRRYAADNPELFPDPSRCIDTCTPDPGSKPVRCDVAEAGVEFMDPPLWTFEEGVTNDAGEIAARSLYTYSDESEDFMEPSGFQPKLSEAIRCGDSETLAFNIRGGLFKTWGGGMGTTLASYVDREVLCSDTSATTACVKAGAEFPFTLDASRWDGISFWARRGPGSQAELRVLAGDKYTDDDLNVADQKYCRILRTCDCDNHKPCTLNTVPAGNGNGEPLQQCFDPAVDDPPPPPGEAVAGGGVDQYGALCGTDRCDEAHPTGAPSPTLGRPCTPYTFQSGETRNVCYTPDVDPLPAEGHEQCGDHWTSTVVLGLDWQFFMVPFSAMRQQGFGKESPQLLTDELSVIRFTWDGGWIDYWLDDVRFYRVSR